MAGTEDTSQSASELGWVADVEKLTLDNDTFRTVVHTGTHAQLTVRCPSARHVVGPRSTDDASSAGAAVSPRIRS